MIFKDRSDAGKKLAEVLLKDKEIISSENNLIVLSLVRGGAAVGYEVAKKLGCPHYPLVVKKIGAPQQEELAIGAVCNGEYFLDETLIERLSLSRKEVEMQVKKAKEKQRQYLKKFGTKKISFKGKVIIIVDDGVATGASVKAAVKCLRLSKPVEIILAVPVSPADFDEAGLDRVFILHKDPYFSAVGQFYRDFDQVIDEGALKYFDK